MTDTRPELPRPPGWLTRVCELLVRQEPELWNWFSGDDQMTRHQEAIRLDLLKSAVHLQPQSHVELHAAATEVAQALGLDVPLAFYQAQQTIGTNVSISTDAKSAHVVFQGDVMDRLDGPELRSVLGHELGHLVLWQSNNGQYQTALRMLSGLCDDPGTDPVYGETMRLFSLFMEVFCDRCALACQGEFDPVISSLIKIETGLKQVNVDDYLRQAEEIRLAGSDFHDKSRNLTHPELYIRTSALKLWDNDPTNCEGEIDTMLRGQISLDGLDLVSRETVANWTLGLIHQILAPEWMRDEAILAHARLYFPDYTVSTPASANPSSVDLELASPELKQSYFAFLLLDFVTTDREILEPALAHTIELADQMGFADAYCEMARRELKLRKKQLQQIRAESRKLVDQARQQHDDSGNRNVTTPGTRHS